MAFLDPLVMTKLESNEPFCAAFVANPSFATEKDERHFPDKKQLADCTDTWTYWLISTYKRLRIVSPSMGSISNGDLKNVFQMIEITLRLTIW